MNKNQIYTAKDYILETLAEAKILREMRAKEGKPPLVVYSEAERKRLLTLWEEKYNV